MPVPLFLIVVALVFVLPIAFARGGHNGPTVVGVVLIIIAIILTIASSPSRSKK